MKNSNQADKVQTKKMTTKLVPMMFPDELYSSAWNRRDHLEGSYYSKFIHSHTTTRRNRAIGFNRFNNFFDNGTLDFDKFAWDHTFAPLLPESGINRENLHYLRTRSTETKMCSECVKSDIKTYGVAFSHRSHNFVGITICHRHRTRLSSTCDACDAPHFQHRPSSYYTCAALAKHNMTTASDLDNLEYRLALFLYQFLNRPIEMTDGGQHDLALRSRAIELGIYKQNQFSKQAIIEFTNQFFSTNSINSTFDTPISQWSYRSPFMTVRVLFALFQSFEQYENHYQNHSTSENSTNKIWQIVENRKHLLSIIRKGGISSIEELNQEYSELASWLQNEDYSWTSATLKKHSILQTRAALHQQRVSNIKQLEPVLYATDAAPQRVTHARIWKALGFNRAYSINARKDEIRVGFESLKESRHHYYVRWLLWIAAQNPKRTLTLTELSKQIEISAETLKPIIKHFGWLENGHTIQLNDLPKSISDIGIDRKWKLDP